MERRDALKFLVASGTCALLSTCAWAQEDACFLTADNALGPYFLPDAPLREALAPEDMPGERLFVSGVVRDRNCEPLEGARVDVWQADAAGQYDFSPDFLLRGHVLSDAAGAYRFETIMPGRYGAGRSFRPAHIHYRVTHPQARTFVTQLYFAGDPYNDRDFLVVPSLVMPIEERDGALHVTFDVTLAA